ncbi:carbohydrate-binding protein [Mucilaginibacter sp. McL0603]|uniref:carbohydrate-binding protein n=1 Tax=Mucilaginibacter sp. McL0603 TaxID=3415670 RepID=UPI003CE6D206
MKISLTALIFITFPYFFNYQTTYSGKPWQNKTQQIPGRIECEYYDEGGEGIAYHDSDSINNGSGKLNPANGSYLNEFRMKEGVDISYTKTDDIDNNKYNKVSRDMDKFYVGWTVPGEWIKYTLKVNESGIYNVALMYTANGDGAISLDLDGKELTGPLKIISTHDDRDTVKWRQWHHWSKTDQLTTSKLEKGIHVLTIHIVANGNMNLDYLEFKKD